MTISSQWLAFGAIGIVLFLVGIAWPMGGVEEPARFSPLANSHIPVEDDGKEGQPFHKQPYPVTSLCACVVGLALGLGAFWLMQYSDHFWLGLFLLLISACIFVYGLNGIFDVMEINTQ